MRQERLFHTLEHLATTCNDTPGEGVTRFSWSDADRRARNWLEQELRGLGLAPWTDGIGNLHARLRGKTGAPAVLVGSHLDTVRHGGRLDGTYGVAAALETLRTFHDEGFTPERDVEFIAFAEEEGSNFGSTCLGSKCLTGQVEPSALDSLRDANGTSATERLRAFGLHPERLPAEKLIPASVRVFLELHIEQNAVLEQHGEKLGIVTAISGMRLHQITLAGHSDHAASPMQGRRDPAAGFAECAWKMEQLWKQGELSEDFSCTIGRMRCDPDVGIIIPRSVTFTIDIRHVDVPTLDAGWARIQALLHEVAAARGLALDIARLSASGGAKMSPKVGKTLQDLAARRGLPCRFMVSGPAHDAAAMGMYVPTGLLFVPSINGLSHCPQEATAPEDLASGARILEDAARFYAASNDV